MRPAPQPSAYPMMVINAAAKYLVPCGFLEPGIYIYLERHMKCGVGK